MQKLTEENRMELLDLIKHNEGVDSNLLKLDAVISSIAINLDINITVDNLEALSLSIYDTIESRLNGHIEKPKLTKVYSNGVFMGYRNQEGELI